MRHGMLPTDPLTYRFYELIMANGSALKALIEEEFGDGIMSAIDLDMEVARKSDPKRDRVSLGMSGKFLPYKYTKGNCSFFQTPTGVDGKGIQVITSFCQLLCILVGTNYLNSKILYLRQKVSLIPLSYRMLIEIKCLTTVQELDAEG